MERRLIESWEDLPRAAEAFLQERVWFDVKATYAPKSHAEMAKDVAALANALGGALIVGASEGSTEPDYSKPLASEYAAKVEGEFDEAVRDYCRPSPTVHVRTIPVPGLPGMVILVVNVDPFVDQPVAVRMEANRDAWRFPQRVGRHTEYLFPEQLPLYMNSKARRAKLLLLRAFDAQGPIDVFTIPPGTFGRTDIQGPGAFLVQAVDAAASGAVLLKDAEQAFSGQSVAVPLDDVEAVWMQTSGRWAARLSGRFEAFTGPDGNSEYELAYIPPGTFVVAPLGRTIENLSKHVEQLGRSLAGTLDVRHHARREPAPEAIRARAYRIWQARAQHDAPGSPEGDWFRARLDLLRGSRDE